MGMKTTMTTMKGKRMMKTRKKTMKTTTMKKRTKTMKRKTMTRMTMQWTGIQWKHLQPRRIAKKEIESRRFSWRSRSVDDDCFVHLREHAELVLQLAGVEATEDMFGLVFKAGTSSGSETRSLRSLWGGA